MSNQNSSLKKIILSGIQPSGTVHLGNYFGMMRPAIELQDKGLPLLFIADYHALTTIPRPDELKSRIFDLAVDFLALGLDPEKTIFFRQSQVPQVTQLTWILSCITPMGLLERCHSYKDKTSKGIPANHGLFAYPVLMAADILIYNSNIVPVGKDQKQHVEVARDIALKFNGIYGDVFTLPEPMIREDVAVIPGIDGQKMSKSYGNTIEIFGNEKEILKKIMSIKTDSTPLEEPKNPDNCPVFAIYKQLATEVQINDIKKKYLAGNYGYGHAKKELCEAFKTYFAPFNSKRKDLANNPDFVESTLKKGEEKAREIASSTMKNVLNAIGL